MKLKINATDVRWWFWALTLVFIVTALAGLVPGYYVVIGVSTVAFFSDTREEPDQHSIADSSRLFSVYPLWAVAGSALVHLNITSVGNDYGYVLCAL